MDRGDLSAVTEGWELKLFTPEGAEALAFLYGRGLTEQYIRKYHFGYVDEGYFAPSVSIPILDGRGTFKTVRFRRLNPGPEQPKYDQFKHERPHLFNISSVRHHVVHITEGEFDATILEQVGRHAVGVPGINNFPEYWKWLFVGNDVRLVFDADEPGSEAWKNVRRAVGQIARWLESVAEIFQVVELPAGSGDITDLFLRGGKEAVEGVLSVYD